MRLGARNASVKVNNNQFCGCSLPKALDAAWTLHTSLRSLEPVESNRLSRGLSSMRAVKEQKEIFQSLGEVQSKSSDISIHQYLGSCI